MPQALDTMFFEALKGDADCGGLVSCNYFSGEPITGMEEGRPLFMRLPDSAFTFQNFARTQLYSAMATLKIGMDILIEKEHAEVDSLLGHGGFFKAKGVGQKADGRCAAYAGLRDGNGGARAARGAWRCWLLTL